ncbi:unnamed protein product, partial [Ranitomeya imitator]
MCRMTFFFPYLFTGVNLDASTPPVEGNCDYTGMQLPAEINVIVCPPDCLEQKEKVWGKTSFAEESSVCAAGIHAGKITNQGGKLIAQKKPGQEKYESFTRNGITTKSHGPSSGSFVLMSISEFQRSRYAQTSIQLPKT